MIYIKFYQLFSFQRIKEIMGNSFENFVIQTERLYLRQVSLKDFSEVAAILQNPKVMYAYEHDFTDEDVYQWINRQIDRYCNYGFGLWAVILKEKGKLIGQAGLTMQYYKDKMVLEIGYLFNENYWNKGYAMEAAEACKNMLSKNWNGIRPIQ